MSDVMQVGKAIGELVRAGKYLEAIDQYYAPNIVSIEPMACDETPARTEGIEAIRKKTIEWESSTTVHSQTVEGPYPHGDRFIMIYKLEMTPKAGPMAGRRLSMSEAALYAVKNGKIVHEEFFYSMG
jgi:ketosteroid isomerase-like protein